MSNDENNGPPASPPQHRRRSSFAGETFANLFGGHRGSVSRSTGTRDPNITNNGDSQQHSTSSYPGSITSAAAQAQRRRLSLTTLGLSGSPNSTSPFGSYNSRRDSYATTGGDSIDESAIEDEPAGSNPTPQTPFARRMSFGAKALQSVRTGGGNTPPGNGQNGGQNPTSASSNGTQQGTLQSKTNGTISSRDAKGRGSSEGFDWSENFRTRAQRGSIVGGMSGLGGGPVSGSAGSPRSGHGRAASVAVMEPPGRDLPKPKEQVRPDHFQERILKGDFYMD
ncbi:hypothetical protein DOTSEDRAFT_75247 [Dothistroma septosporum NZE10]|uniref:Uncharacterized protein n=1 Tax=Dothistroma septosporum (strain NZE10 / CBS 128990) TaxID=675120 RepID=M2XJ86_DOTSN|nr:hypothetical protein DOTSEDRAFT_75247 [Dothistroma septosporum NZE10]